MGCVFCPQPVQKEDEILIGFRMLSIVDIASGYIMHFDHLPCAPSAVDSATVIKLLSDAIKIHGAPRQGIVISHSVWLSSTELALDEDTATQGEFLQRYDIQFGPMTHEDKVRIRDWILSLGVRCEFNADNIPVE